MRENNDVDQMIDQLIAADGQPSEEEMSELRKRLRQKVVQMTHRGRYAVYVCLGGASLMLLGYVAVVIAASGSQDNTWWAQLGFGTLVAGAVVVIGGCVGLLAFRGFGFVWARHDFQEAAIAELSLQVERLSEKLDKLSERA